MVQGTRELIAGVVRDPQFGPCVMLGVGGVLAEALGDVAFRVVPLTDQDAQDLIDDLATKKLLDEFRGEPAVDRAALGAGVDRAVRARRSPARRRVGRREPADRRRRPSRRRRRARRDRRRATDRHTRRPPRPRRRRRWVPRPLRAARRRRRRRVHASRASSGSSRSTTSSPPASRDRSVRPTSKPCRCSGSTPCAASTNCPTVRGISSSCARPRRPTASCSAPRPSAGSAPRSSRARVTAKRATRAGAPSRSSSRSPASSACCSPGPNGQGVVSTPAHLCAQIVAPYPPAGRIAIASQSGNFVSSFLNWAVQTGVGVSRAVSAGNAAAVGIADYLEWYADDPATAVSLAYVEGVTDGRALYEHLRSVATRKPVVLVKGGTTSGGVRAAASHTGSLASDDRVFDGMCRRPASRAPPRSKRHSRRRRPSRRSRSRPARASRC